MILAQALRSTSCMPSSVKQLRFYNSAMRISLLRDPLPPQVRALEPWRDGRQLAALIESAFSREEIGSGGARMIELLRNYGQYEPMMFGLGTSFVWIEGGRLVGNASIQRNPTRPDTWIVGNVATDPDHRRRGIARALIDACMRHAGARGARHIALLVDEDNANARGLYETLGFRALGVTTYSLHEAIGGSTRDSTQRMEIREARWADRAAVWALTRGNITDDYTFAEPFDAGLYRLGMFWSLRNVLGGRREKWFVFDDEQAGVIGAVRVHIGREEPHHHVELMLGRRAEAEHGVGLLLHALRSLARAASLPVAAAQSHTHAAAEAAIAQVGFRSKRVLVHMKRDYA
jgi:GNAT superfamily N-acetyltransferase